MTDKQNRPAFAGDVAHLTQALLLKFSVAHRQHLIHDQYLGVEVGGDGERQAHVHTAGVALDGSVDELLHTGKVHNFIELAVDLILAHAEDGAVEKHVLAPGQLGVEAGADLQQAADAPLDLDHAAGGRGDAREDLEQRGLAGAVAPDDAQRLALLHGEGDVIQRQDGLTDALEVVALPDAGVGVGLVAQARPPAVEVAAEGAGADDAEVIAFG